MVNGSLVCTVFFLLISMSANAYIPPSKMIFQRTAANQGNRGYQVVIDSRLKGDPENMVFRETWTVKDDLSMKVKVVAIQPANLHFTREYVYVENKRHWLGPTGKVLSVNLQENHLERLFHFRDGERMDRFLKRNEVLPRTNATTTVAASASDNPVLEPGSEPSDPSMIENTPFPHRPEPYVRLARWDGSIHYAFGIPSLSEGPRLFAGLWIEQDRFLIRRLRTRDMVEVQASNYQKRFGLSFPRQREVLWKGNAVTLSLVAINRAVIGPKTRKALQPSQLPNSTFELKNEMADTLNSSIINEFYQRFR